MRKCALVMPFGRNWVGVLEDAEAYLASQDYEPSRVVLVALDTDEHDLGDTGHVVVRVSRNDYWRGPTLTDIDGDEYLPVVFVMNGGTTVQQWALASCYWIAVHYEKMDDAVKRPGQPPVENEQQLVLDVQKDSVVVLDQYNWQW